MLPRVDMQFLSALYVVSRCCQETAAGVVRKAVSRAPALLNGGAGFNQEWDEEYITKLLQDAFLTCKHRGDPQPQKCFSPS